MSEETSPADSQSPELSVAALQKQLADAEVKVAQHWERLLRKQDGTCFFLQMGNHCSVYAYRPLECQLYPYVLVYKDGVLGLELHEACPQRVCAPVPEIPDSLRWLPKEWWLEFEKLET